MRHYYIVFGIFILFMDEGKIENKKTILFFYQRQKDDE